MVEFSYAESLEKIYNIFELWLEFPEYQVN